MPRTKPCWYICYRTLWDGELDHQWVRVMTEPEQLVVELRSYRPTDHVVGYPAGERYQAKQARLLADLRARYAARLAELLAEVPEFAERVV